MTFTKPSNMTYTDIAKWVDSYKPEYSEDTLVEYLYHLMYINTQRSHFFTDKETCDDFCLYCVSKLYYRVKNKDKDPLKSIVNYIKTVIEPWHAEYVREFCCGSAEGETATFDIHDFADYLIDTVSQHDYHVYNFDCLKISDITYTYLRQIPVKKHSDEWSNICTSCLLTLTDRIQAAINTAPVSLLEDDPHMFNRIIRKTRMRKPILYHLQDTYEGYISVLVNQLIHAISMELTTCLGETVSASACLKNMVIAAANNEEE